jgi:large subunit ribosomal protein L28
MVTYNAVATNASRKDCIMAKCESCGKSTTFGHNRSFSMRATNRKFKPNLQKVTIFENGKKIRKTLCTRCMRTMVKS